MKGFCKRKYLILIVSISLALGSCHDYRLENATSDISRSWYLVKYELNNGDSTFYFTSMITNYTITFTTEGAYTESFEYYGTPVTINGYYVFQDNISELVLSDEDTTRVFDVVNLTTNHLTIELMNTPDDDDIYFLEPL